MQPRLQTKRSPVKVIGFQLAPFHHTPFQFLCRCSCTLCCCACLSMDCSSMPLQVWSALFGKSIASSSWLMHNRLPSHSVGRPAHMSAHGAKACCELYLHIDTFQQAFLCTACKCQALCPVCEQGSKVLSVVHLLLTCCTLYIMIAIGVVSAHPLCVIYSWLLLQALPRKSWRRHGQWRCFVSCS